MAVNLSEPGDLVSIPGVSLATAAAAIKAGDRDDMALIVFEPDTSVAAVFTRSSFRAAPVVLAESRIDAAEIRALLINSGNANAATGSAGMEDARLICRVAATRLKVDESAVVPFSTGVIGERLPVEKMTDATGTLVRDLSEDGWLAAARAILTTDTVAKALSTTISIDGVPVTITGIAKGSGMIRPDMATMLAFVCCDAYVSRECLTALIGDVTAGSFNRITVDGDTSTNDAFVVAATGVAEHERITDPDSEAAGVLKEGLMIVSRMLAQAIVRDGEGATKFVTVRVSGGREAAECLSVAYTVAESPLVKTALFASDPNWGRLAMAIGRAGVDDLDVANVDVWFDKVQVMASGMMAPGYTEEAGAAVLAREEFVIRIELGRGGVTEEVWTSDLSYDYVRINSEYRT